MQLVMFSFFFFIWANYGLSDAIFSCKKRTEKEERSKFVHAILLSGCSCGHYGFWASDL